MPPTLQATIITAGGQARRYGSDKVLARLSGQTLLERAAASLPPAPTRLIVSGQAAHTLAGWVTIPDLRPGLGPLAGLETGLAAIPDGWAALCAADMPHLNAEFWATLLRYATPDTQAVIGLDGGARRQPLAALYHTSSLSNVRQLLDAHNYRMASLLAQLRVHEVPFALIEATTRHAFHNVNYLEDLHIEQ